MVVWLFEIQNPIKMQDVVSLCGMRDKKEAVQSCIKREKSVTLNTTRAGIHLRLVGSSQYPAHPAWLFFNGADDPVSEVALVEEILPDTTYPPLSFLH